MSTDSDNAYRNRPIGRPNNQEFKDPNGIPYKPSQFQNTYDGQCRKIIDYCVECSENDDYQFVGLFGEVRNATLKNIVMDSAYHLTATLSLPDGCHYSPFYLTFTPDAPAPTPNVVTTSEPHSVGSWGWQLIWNGKNWTYSRVWTVTTKYYDVATTTTVTNVGWTFSSLTKGTVVT